MEFVSWYDRDAAWNDSHFPLPLPSRRAVVTTMIGNVRDGMSVVRVSRDEPIRGHRLMLLVDETKGPKFNIWWTFRPFTPFHHYMDVVNRVAFLFQDGKHIHNDPFPDLGTGCEQVQTVRTLADHMRLVTMLVRWREHVGAKNRRREDVLKLCLLTCGRSDVMKVLHDDGFFLCC